MHELSRDGRSITLNMMRLALLGADTESLALARAAEAAGHSIVWCGDFAGESLPSGWPAEDRGDVWEGLLDGEEVEAAIVGRGAVEQAVRSEQVSQLVKSGVPTLASFPLIDSVLAYYEIDMARGESGAVLQHYNPLTEHHAIVDQCAAWIDSGHPELGAVEQVVWERPLEDRTQSRVLWHFTRDVELLGLVSGGLNRLGALGSPDEAATYAGLSVQLLGKREVPVRWQVGPVETDEHPRLILVAQRGKLTITFDETAGTAQISLSQAGQTESQPPEHVDAATQMVGWFADAVRSSDGKATTTWSRALAAMELTDTIEIALRRGRMIEVHQQQLTEQMAFKGTMSALGCGVLLLVPPLLLFLGWIAELVGLPVSVTKAWPIVLLVFLGLFLALQLVPKLLFKADS